jgi:hypothetical protein
MAAARVPVGGSTRRPAWNASASSAISVRRCRCTSRQAGVVYHSTAPRVLGLTGAEVPRCGDASPVLPLPCRLAVRVGRRPIRTLTRFRCAQSKLNKGLQKVCVTSLHSVTGPDPQRLSRLAQVAHARNRRFHYFGYTGRLAPTSRLSNSHTEGECGKHGSARSIAHSDAAHDCGIACNNLLAVRWAQLRMRFIP